MDNDINMEYGTLCAKLGDLYVRGEINDRQIAETTEKLHKLQLKAKKLAAVPQPQVVPDEPPVETPEELSPVPTQEVQ